MKVKVKDWGELYTTYNTWFKENNCEEYRDRYMQKNRLIDHLQYYYDNNNYPVDKNGNLINLINMTFEVIKEGRHRNFKDKIIYLIEEPITKNLYLIGKNGTEEIK